MRASRPDGSRLIRKHSNSANVTNDIIRTRNKMSQHGISLTALFIVLNRTPQKFRQSRSHIILAPTVQKKNFRARMRIRCQSERDFHFQYKFSRSRSFLSVDSIVSGRVLLRVKFFGVNGKSNMAIIEKFNLNSSGRFAVIGRCMGAIAVPASRMFD